MKQDEALRSFEGSSDMLSGSSMSNLSNTLLIDICDVLDDLDTDDEGLSPGEGGLEGDNINMEENNKEKFNRANRPAGQYCSFVNI